ncbi:hypothetical protein LTR09_012386 [Extremus antarcticus]|uniref:HTH psq-type domain-containing protein n=1 Tax=Extremus antarcticus TaxID=702011 RepID=A0AAJ0DA41_9PEZI|nr:hypothetical protein LTR09_012386 [Extremus antarcticus]
MATNDEDWFHYETSLGTYWDSTPHIDPHSTHSTTVQDYSGFSYSHERNSASSSANGQQPMAQILQTVVMPPWPSMLRCQSSADQAAVLQSSQPIQTTSIGQAQIPFSATSTPSAPTPRKILTDFDRKRICQYAEDHPNSKQTEIGAVFDIERSTVSKILRQKDKYLVDSGESPAKRAKMGKSDLDSALPVRAIAEENEAKELTDDGISTAADVLHIPKGTPPRSSVEQQEIHSARSQDGLTFDSSESPLPSCDMSYDIDSVAGLRSDPRVNA